MRLIWHFAVLISLLWELTSAKLVVVPHDHPSVTYTPRVCDNDCTRDYFQHWWKIYLADGVWSYRTKGNTTSATFTFKGSSVTWYGFSSPDGAKALVYLDDTPVHVVDTYSPQSERVIGWTYIDLDPSQQHTLSINYDHRAFSHELPERWLDIRCFEYDDGTYSVITTSPPPRTRPETTATSSTKDTGTNLGRIQATTITATATTTEIEIEIVTAEPFISSPNTVKASLILGTGKSQPSATGGANVSTTRTSQDSSNPITRVIIGTTIGSGVLALSAILFLLHRRRKKKQLEAMYVPEPLPLLDHRNGSGPPNTEIPGRAPTSHPPPMYLTNSLMESRLSNPTSVSVSRPSRKALETGMDLRMFTPIHPNLQHSGRLSASYSPTTEAPTPPQRPVIPNRSASRRQHGRSMAASVWSGTHIVETDESEEALTCRVIPYTRPPRTPPPRYALRSPDAYDPPKMGTYQSSSAL